MSSYVNMSLEDIIQKNKRDITRSKKTNKVQPRAPPQKLTTIDARNKIISKKRTKITDAREKLIQLAKQKDARLKLEQLRQERLGRTQIQGRNIFNQQLNQANSLRNIPHKVFMNSSRQVMSQPYSASILAKRQLTTKKFMENRSIETRTRDKRKMPKPKPILRTIENDIEIIDDPMEGVFIPPKTTLSNRKASLQLRIIAHNDDRLSVQRTAIAEKEKSPPMPPSILKKRPMAALRNDKKSQKAEKPALEYRIIVSNLRSSVTAGDIEELFGDVGGMLESRLVRPGTAEVMYKSLENAQEAVDLYHNRQLDGQPMNCLLVTPRVPASSSKSSSKPALISSSSNVEPDISTFHKVLFSNL